MNRLPVFPNETSNEMITITPKEGEKIESNRELVNAVSGKLYLQARSCLKSDKELTIFYLNKFLNLCYILFELPVKTNLVPIFLHRSTSFHPLGWGDIRRWERGCGVQRKP